MGGRTQEKKYKKYNRFFEQRHGKQLKSTLVRYGVSYKRLVRASLPFNSSQFFGIKLILFRISLAAISITIPESLNCCIGINTIVFLLIIPLNHVKPPIIKVKQMLKHQSSFTPVCNYNGDDL
jgi:hypothetical protein